MGGDGRAGQAGRSKQSCMQYTPDDCQAFGHDLQHIHNCANTQPSHTRARHTHTHTHTTLPTHARTHAHGTEQVTG